MKSTGGAAAPLTLPGPAPGRPLHPATCPQPAPRTAPHHGPAGRSAAHRASPPPLPHPHHHRPSAVERLSTHAQPAPPARTARASASRQAAGALTQPAPRPKTPGSPGPPSARAGGERAAPVRPPPTGFREKGGTHSGGRRGRGMGPGIGVVRVDFGRDCGELARPIFFTRYAVVWNTRRDAEEGDSRESPQGQHVTLEAIFGNGPTGTDPEHTKRSHVERLYARWSSAWGSPTSRHGERCTRAVG